MPMNVDAKTVKKFCIFKPKDLNLFHGNDLGMKQRSIVYEPKKMFVELFIFKLLKTFFVKITVTWQ